MHRLAAMLPSIVRGDPEAEGEEPRPNRARRIVVAELAMDGHENLVRNVFDVPLGHAETPQRPERVGRLELEQGSKVEWRALSFADSVLHMGNLVP